MSHLQTHPRPAAESMIAREQGSQTFRLQSLAEVCFQECMPKATPSDTWCFLSHQSYLVQTNKKGGWGEGVDGIETLKTTLLLMNNELSSHDGGI